MIGNKVRAIIEMETKRVASNNLFFRKAFEGTLSRKHLTAYLYNLEFLFKQTTVNLTYASNCANERGLFDVAIFMDQKKREEEGHDQWARNDLQHSDLKTDETHYRLKPSLSRIFEFVKELITEDPRLFLSYMCFVEYFTVLVAPSFLDNLENKCGISRAAMTSITNHEELDKDHALEDFNVINNFCNDRIIEKRFFEALTESIKLVDSFLSECAVA